MKSLLLRVKHVLISRLTFFYVVQDKKGLHKMNQQPPNPEGQYSPNPYTQNPGQFPQSGQNYPQQPPPGYPYPQQPQKKKPGIFKIGCGVLVGVVVLIVIIAIASGGKSNTGEKVNTTSNNSTSSQPPSKP